MSGDSGGVDLYVGGVEHAVLHLLYSRFWHKALFDLGHVSTPEPFHRLYNQGYIQAASYQDSRGIFVEASEVVEENGTFKFENEPVTRSFGKMGKSLRNSVTPDEMYDEFGADTLRLYEMFMGPLDQDRPWETKSVVGSLRLLQRVWRNLVNEETGVLAVTDEETPLELKRVLNQTIESVRGDMEGLRFNTAIARITELNNEITKSSIQTPREVAEVLAQLIAPLVPHIAEELWEMLGNDTSIVYSPFPVSDPAYLVTESIEIPIQINGKLKSRISVPTDCSSSDLRDAALADEKISSIISNSEIKKEIIVEGKLVNFVI